MNLKYHSILTQILKKRIHQIESFKQNPFSTQKKVFEKLLFQAKNTHWGLKYGYSQIKNYSDFKNKVPIQDYASLKPYIEKIRAGKQNILWPSPILWFAQSSGTTAGKSKYIPISKEALHDCHFKGGKDLMSIYLNQYPRSKVLSGKSMALGGSIHTSPYKNKSSYGDLSAILIENFPFWFQLIKTPSKEIALLNNWEKKIDQIAKMVSQKNVTNFSGVPSWNLILLQKILQITNKKNILEVWPNLELYIHGGVKFDPYLKQYQNLIPNQKMRYMETYNASEGFFGLQDQIDSKELLLMLDYGIFFEFLPLENIHQKNPETLQLDEVSTNQNYALIISTNSGLWRYMIGDTIKFTSLHPFRIVLSGRTKYFINLFGEELIEDNTNKALMYTCHKTNAIVQEFTVAPIFPNQEGKGGHEWAIEFQKEPENMDQFTTILDLALQNENSDYEAKRYKNMALQKPKINILPPNSFYHWLKLNGKLGGQNKVPKLSEKRVFLEEILTIKNNL